jgi:G3E family GTPase
VIVNDFGAINIDSRLVDVVEGEAMSLTNGCVCCSMRGSLVTTVLELLARTPPLEALLVEASGIADPTGIAGAFRTSRLRPLTRIDGIITLVDAENARSPRLDAQLIEEQISTADIVILNKIDLVTEGERRDLERWIRTLTPTARLVTAVGADVAPEILLGAHTAGTVPAENRPAHDHDHPSSFATWSFSTGSPLSYRRVRAALESLPVDVFRAKGTLALADAPNLRFVAQVVGRRVTVEPAGLWQAQTPFSDLVFIGAPGATTSDDLARHFDACVTDSFVLMSRDNFTSMKERVTTLCAGSAERVHAVNERS